MRKVFSIYGLQRPDGSIFYVGRAIAVTSRVSAHLLGARRHHRTATSAAIRAILASGGHVGFTVLAQARSSAAADVVERQIIAQFGLRNLTNVHPGGSGGPYTGIDGGDGYKRGTLRVCLRDIPPDLWKRVQAKATAQKTSIRALILRQLAQWVNEP